MGGAVVAAEVDQGGAVEVRRELVERNGGCRVGVEAEAGQGQDHRDLEAGNRDRGQGLDQGQGRVRDLEVASPDLDREVGVVQRVEAEVGVKVVQEADRDQDHLQDQNLAPGLNQGQDQDQHLQRVLTINYVMN